MIDILNLPVRTYGNKWIKVYFNKIPAVDLASSSSCLNLVISDMSATVREHLFSVTFLMGDDHLRYGDDGSVSCDKSGQSLPDPVFYGNTPTFKNLVSHQKS